MKQEIAKNQYYEVFADPEKNRLYYNIFGFWRSVDLVPNNYEDLRIATTKLKPGFDILADLRTMKPPPETVAELHISTQKLVVEKGLSKTAEVYDEETVKFMGERYSRESKMDTQVFSSMSEAEAWLDSFKK